MRFKSATGSDKEYFRDLNRKCYREVVIRQFGNWDEQRQDSNFEAKWPSNNFRKIIINGEIIGGVWVDEHPDYLQLREIQIHPNYQGQGYGTEAVEDAVARSKREGKSLRLRVLHKNKALELYERMGFHVIEKTEHQYVMEYT